MIPDTIRLMHMDIKVKQHDIHYSSDDTRVYGEWDERNTTINIDTNTSYFVITDTLMHELLHAILGMYDKDSEELVRILSPALMQVFRDNPMLVEFFLSQPSE